MVSQPHLVREWPGNHAEGLAGVGRFSLRNGRGEQAFPEGREGSKGQAGGSGDTSGQS